MRERPEPHKGAACGTLGRCGRDTCRLSGPFAWAAPMPTRPTARPGPTPTMRRSSRAAWRISAPPSTSSSSAIAARSISSVIATSATTKTPPISRRTFSSARSRGSRDSKVQSTLATWLYRIAVNVCLNRMALKTPRAEALDPREREDLRAERPDVTPLARRARRGSPRGHSAIAAQAAGDAHPPGLS